MRKRPVSAFIRPHSSHSAPQPRTIRRLTTAAGPTLRHTPHPAAHLHTRPLRPYSTSEQATPAGPTARYQQLVAAGTLRADEHQESVVKLLQSLHDEVGRYTPPSLKVDEQAEPAKKGWREMFSSFLPDIQHDIVDPELLKAAEEAKAARGIRNNRIPDIPSNAPKSLYLYGSVGTGKTFLMDLFYDSLPGPAAPATEDTPAVPLPKRRAHFHAFMIDVHKRLHKYVRLAQSAAPGLSAAKQDAVVPVARDLAREARVLCFDEFQVTDIADAMILRRLLEALLGYGVVIIMTSNRHPSELYKNGIQRESFVPCIELIQKQCTVKDLNSGTDYRKIPRAVSKVYYHPRTPENVAEIDKLFESLCSARASESEPPDDQIVLNATLKVWGRNLKIPISSKDRRVAKFTFAELCGESKSAADYIEITNTFETIFVTDIPNLTFQQRDLARRFILFIDAAYESKTKLFALSEGPIHQMFSDKGRDSSTISDHMRAVMDEQGLSASAVGASSIFTGEEEMFAFARAVSRIVEMGSVQWAQRARQ